MSEHKFPPVRWDELIKKLRSFGFDGPYAGGRHPYMIRDATLLTVPNPQRSQIGVDLLIRILKQAEITREEWLS